MGGDQGGSLKGKQILAISTVAQSLALQMPGVWNYLKRNGAELTFAAAPDGWEEALKRWGDFVPIRGSRRPTPTSAVNMLRDIRRVIRYTNWDLIQTQTPIASAVTRLLPRSSAQLLYVAHGFHFHRDGKRLPNLMFETLERVLAHRADAIAVVSREDWERIHALGLDKRTHTWRLPGAGVDLAPFLAIRTPGRKGPIRLVFIGEMNTNKDPLKVVRVAELVGRSEPVELTMVGDGPLVKQVELRLRNSTVTHCRLIRRSSDVPGLLTKADVLLAPSIREGLPRVVIEAMAAGVSIVARSNRGTRELLAGGVGECLPASAGDSEWAQAVLRVHSADDSDRLRERAAAYSEDEALASYACLLSLMLKGDGPPLH